MNDYEKIRRLFMYGMSVITYYSIVLPEVHELHQTTRSMDVIATLMLRRGDLIPPCILKRKFDPMDPMDCCSFS